MTAALRSSTLCLAAGLSVLLSGGCGSTSPKADQTTVARLVTEANAVCKTSPPGAVVLPARLHPIMTALRKAVLYLPAGRAIHAGEAKLHAVRADLHHLSSGSFERGMDDIDLAYRSETQIYDGWKTIGLTSCIGRPPRKPIGG
jgi:hypothetical protein